MGRGTGHGSEILALALEMAVRTFSDAVSSLRAAGNLADELSSTLVLPDMEIARGRLAREILVLQALAHEAQGHRATALAALERALVQTGLKGYVRLFLDEGAPMVALLQAGRPAAL